MYVYVDAVGSTVTLHEHDDFKRFHIEAVGVTDNDAHRVAELLGADASVFDDEHVWIAIAQLRCLAVQHATDAWSAEFDNMLQAAAKYGWTDEAGLKVRAHIKWNG